MNTRTNTALYTALIVTIFCSAGRAQDDLKARVDKAKSLKVKDVCTPIRSARGGNTILVPNRDGKTYDLLVRYHVVSYWGPHTTYIIDLATNEIKTHFVPNALYNRHTLGPDGKLYSHRTGAIWVYDPSTNEITDLPEAPVGGETQPIVTGTDGMIYGGGARGARACAYQLDPKTGRIKDYGPMGPSHEPNACWGYSLAADDRYIYIASGKIPWYLVCYDKQTGKDEVLLKTDDPRGYIEASQGRYGCTGSVRGHGKSARYWLYQGKAIEKKDPKERPPWPVPEKPKPWIKLPPRPEVWKTDVTSEGKVKVWVRLAEAAAHSRKKNPPSGGRLSWRIYELDVSTFAAPITRVCTLDDGRIFGASGAYLGNFIYDPKTRRSRHMGRLPLSHYTQTVLGGKVYMSGYPGSALFVYDPARPWTAAVSERPGDKPLRPEDKRSNPRHMAWLSHAGSGCHKMWTSAAAADGKVYFGGRWYRNGVGGGLGWWDPAEPDAKKAAGGISKPFANYQVIWMTTTGSGRYVVVSTLPVRDQATGTPAPKAAKLFVFDTQAGKIIHEHVPFSNSKWTGAIAGVDGDDILGLTINADEREKARQDGAEEKDISYGKIDTNSWLYRLNVLSGKIVYKKTLPYPVCFRTNENFAHQDGSDFRLGPDGKVWTFTGARFTPCNPKKSWHYSYSNFRIVEDEKAEQGFRLDGMNCALVRIDPKDGAVEVVGKITHGGEMTFSGRDLYLAGGCKYLMQRNSTLRRVQGVVPQ